MPLSTMSVQFWEKNFWLPCSFSVCWTAAACVFKWSHSTIFAIVSWLYFYFEFLNVIKWSYFLSLHFALF